MRRHELLYVLCTVAVSTIQAFVLTPSALRSSIVNTPCRTTAPSRFVTTSSSPWLVRQLTVGGEDPGAVTLQSTWQLVTNVGALVVGALVLAEVVQDWPRGWVNRQLVEAGPSTLGPQAGRGLFAARNIPRDTVIGNFPGVVSSRASWLGRKDSEEAALLARRYTWSLATGDVLDPTLSNGELPDTLIFFGGLLRIPTLLALVNEPRAGMDLNVVAVVSERDVAYVAERDIFAGRSRRQRGDWAI